MYPIRIEWIPANEGGRKSGPPVGRYYPVSRFPEDVTWPSNAWSVLFDLDEPILEDGVTVSYGAVRFLMNNTPKERMEKNKHFEIYEGPRKVAHVFLLHD